MASSSSRASMSSTSRQVNGGSSMVGVMSPTSAGSSDVSSTASITPSRTGSSKTLNTTFRLGNLHGAGLSSLQLALGEASASSSSSSKPGLTGFNAISTLLNDPKRPQRAIDPSSSRYPAISQSHTDLPKVKRSELEGYITSTKKEWERYQRNLRLGSRGKARLELDDVELESKRQSLDRIHDLDPSEVDHTAALGKKKLPPLSTVPQVFFAEDFDLGNPYTFDLVTERYKAASGTSNTTRNGSAVTSNGYDVALNQMLQEKLSYYSDVVEQHLILEISARSTSFFAALGNLQDLEAEAAHCLKRVESLKAELEDKEENIAIAGLRVIREQAKRREMVERLEAVGILQLLCEKKDLCRLLVQSGEWSEALDVMDLLRNVVLGKEKLQNTTSADTSLPPHVVLDFTSIASVNAFLPQLDEMKESISTQLQSELISLLSQDLQFRIGEPEQSVLPPPDFGTEAAPITSNGEVGQEAGVASNSSTPAIDTAEFKNIVSISASPQETGLQQRITALLLGLVRTRGIDRTVNLYRDMALKATKRTMRVFLCQSKTMQADDSKGDLATLLEDDEAASGKADIKLGPGGAEAAGRLREIDHHAFLDMARFVLMGQSKCLQGVDLQTRVILRVLAQAGKAEAEDGSTFSVMMPMGVSPSLPSMLASTLSDIGGLTHVLSSRLLSLRSSIHINLSLADFLAVFHLCWSFILESEAICNRMIIGLRGVVLNQAKSWLANFHRIRIERAARAVEEEKWNQADTNTSQQKLIELIVDSATADPVSLVIKVGSKDTSALDGQAESSENAVGKTLMIEERQYFVVGATLDILDMLVEYLKAIINLPLLSTETMGKVVEFAKQFNSRTCQVVLGAGAMRSAGLSNITAKHLALASQSLSVMITLIPYVRETVRRHLSPKQAVMLIEFDKLKRDYQEHQYEIHSKLVAIMSDRLTVHCRAMNNVQWNTDGEATEPIKPASDLAKETTTLHKVLCRYLQASVVEHVIGQVLIAIDKRISADFRKVDVKEEAALQKMNVAKTYFDEKFNALKYVEWSAKEIDEAIEEQKAVLEKNKVASVPLPEKKEAIPAYKPRINIFGRKNQATPGTPPSARVSLDAAPVEKSEEAVPAAVLKSEAQVEAVGEEFKKDESNDKPDVPAKDETSDTVINEQDQPPSLPEKEKEETITSHATPVITLETSEVIPRSTSSPLPSSRPPTPASPSTPATPARSTQESFASPSPTPGRMTLQQRLAEAARKRAQGNANRLLPQGEAVSSGVSTPVRAEEEVVSVVVPLQSDADIAPQADAEVAMIAATIVEPAMSETRKKLADEPAIVSTSEPAIKANVEPAGVSEVEQAEEKSEANEAEHTNERQTNGQENEGNTLQVEKQVEKQEANDMQVGDRVEKADDKNGSTVEDANAKIIKDMNAIESAGDTTAAEEDVVESGEGAEAIRMHTDELESIADESKKEEEKLAE